MKLDRLISIVVLLLRKDRVQARELAELFGVSVRTILRDVDAINLAGIPIVTYQGMNGGIGIAEGYRLDRSVLSSDDLASLISLLRGVPGVLSGEKSTVLINKLQSVLTNSQLQDLSSKANQLVLDPTPWGGHRRLKESITLIRGAIETRDMLEFEYYDFNIKTTTRQVEPYSLILKGQHWYLYAWCALRADFRMFKVLRIRGLERLNRHFVPRDAHLEENPWEREWQSNEKMIHVTLLFERGMEKIVFEWFDQEGVETEDGKVLMRLNLPENNWLNGFILSFGNMVEVLEPHSLRDVIASITREIYLKYAEKHDTESSG